MATARRERAGTSAERLVFLPPEAQLAEHLRQYHRIDIALDTFPYNGTARQDGGLTLV